MKKILFTIAVLGITMQAQSQITEKSDGKVGIGTTVPSSKLHVNYATTSGEISKNGINSVLITQATTNVTSYDKGIYSSIGNFGIAPNITDTGYKIGLDASAFSSSINFKGTLNSNFGVWARAGIYNATPGAKINLAVGLEAQVLDNVAGTTIENVYGVRISTGAYNKTTVTNRYDLYAGTVNANNYFAGNVGVGTISPNAKLEVQHSSVRTVEVNPQNQLDVTGNSSITIKEFVPSIEFNDSSSSSESALAFANNNKFFIGKKTGTKVTESNLFNVDLNSGNVGIGTTTPESNLQIGRSTTRGLIMLGGGKGYSSIGSTRSDGGLILGKNVYARYQDATDNFNGRVGKTASTGFTGIKIGQNGLINFFGKSGNVTADEIANTSQTSRMMIHTNGNVGIGTTTPDEKLAVNGKIHTKEVKVDLVGWPDYVFTKEYNLPTLTEVENHIKTKGHLANIPSAKEVEKAGGIELGSMNKKLLQKVEELTLYTIQQEKKIENSERNNKKLLSIIEKLEERMTSLENNNK